MPDTSFATFVRDFEAGCTPDELAELDAWRAYYRGDGPAPAGAWVDPRDPRPSSPAFRDSRLTEGDPS